MDLLLANPRGFCAGVDRAVRIVDELLALRGAPVFVRHEIVHNKAVVDDLKRRGAEFVDDIEAIPVGALAVLSAHGVSPDVKAAAIRRRLELFDATCPLVTKVHLEVMRHSVAGRAVLLVGHRGHVEVIGTLGHYSNPRGDGIFVVENDDDARSVEVPRPDHVAYVTQTTLAVDATQRIVVILRGRFPALLAPARDDICYATQNRQDAVRTLCARSELVIVIGSPKSSNSVRMCEVAQECGAEARLIETADEIQAGWLAGRRVVGLSASASAPAHLVGAAVDRIRTLVPGVRVAEIGMPEEVVFKLPIAIHALRSRAAFPEPAPPAVPLAQNAGRH